MKLSIVSILSTLEVTEQNNDSGIWPKFQMGIRFDSDKMNIPEKKGVAAFPAEKLHYLVGDKIFPLITTLIFFKFFWYLSKALINIVSFTIIVA